MRYKSCITCRYFSENVLDEEDKSFVARSTWCTHPLSAGARTSREMIFDGPCGRDLKLWDRKRNKYSPIEEAHETD